MPAGHTRVSSSIVLRLIYLSIHVVVALHFFDSNGLTVDGTPCKENVSQYERHNERDIRHRLQSKQTGRAVGYRQRALYIVRRRIISRVVISCYQEQCQHREYRTCTCKPDTAYESCVENTLQNAEEYQHHAHKEQHRHSRHFEEVLKILTLHFYKQTGSSIEAYTFLEQDMYHKSQEKKTKKEPCPQKPDDDNEPLIRDNLCC